MYAIVDIETTGGYAANHKITEVAIYHHDGMKVTGKFHLLVNPRRNIPAFITGLTGIDNNTVKDAPPFEEVAHEIFDKLRDRVFVAHNAHFDYTFLKNELDACGIKFQTKKLCTVRLGRKIIPGLGSYSLGRLAESLGIEIINRHRAGGDAEATAKIFDLLLKRDASGYITQALKKNSGETILPPNLDKQEFDQLPAKAGVYYFINGRGKIIYVGKALNIKKRIAGHFTGDAREWNRTRVRNEIHHIKYQLTGNELIAFILEAQEIQRLWPKYNLAQKSRVEEWGIYTYQDQDGYQRFSVNTVMRGTQPLTRFPAKGDAWNFLWEQVKVNKLCPKLSGLQQSKGLCFDYQNNGGCDGACMGIKSSKVYNKRIDNMLSALDEEEITAALFGNGRTNFEQAYILIEKGKCIGYGFIKRGHPSRDEFEFLKKSSQPSKENRVVQNLINAYLQNPREYELVYM
jgi:DNA polymerase III subunit epsilon